MLKFPDDISLQIILPTPKKHSIVFSVLVDKFMEQATELAALSIISAQVPQLETILYLSVEQLESTAVQLKTSCSELMPINWTLVGGGGGSIWTKYYL